MRAVILSIGTELLRGDIVDTNAAYLARELSQIGFNVERQVTAGDDLPVLTDVVRDSFQRADVIVGTGGLGPTGDDLTRDAIAAALGEELFIDESLVGEIERRFASMRRSMPARNRKQAQLIPSARAIPNPNGTAPGWLVRRNGRTIVAMPGPPSEMQPMWTSDVLPELESLLPGHIATLPLMTFGLGESAVEERIDDVIDWHADVTVATYAKANGVQVHITARGDSSNAAERLVSQAGEMIQSRLGGAVFGTGDATLGEAVGNLLRERHLSLAVMESCTGGALASVITDVEGSSDYFNGGIVAYSRALKEKYGVEPATIDEFGLISEHTAAAMSDAVLRTVGADVGVGVTGIAGVTAVEGKPPGNCYIAVNIRGEVAVRHVRRPGARASIKQYFALCALDNLRRRLLEESTE